MADLTVKKSNYISRSVAAGATMLEQIDELRALKREGLILDYGNPGVLGDDDFTGANDHLNRADLIDFFGAIDAIVATLEANGNAHYEALYNLVR